MQDKDILAFWEDRLPGDTRRDVAERVGLTLGQFRSALYRARKFRKENSDHDSEVRTNHAVVTSKSPMTLEQLLELYELSLDEWAVTKVVANKWEVGRKGSKQRIEWSNDGVIGKGSFSEDDGKIFKEPLFQIKAWLVRKEPVEVQPVVKPIVFSELFEYEDNYLDRDWQVALVLPDTHFGFKRNIRTGKLTPFHDRLALECALHLARRFEPDYVIWLGDILDLAEMTDKFVRTPELWGVLQPAVYEAAWWMNQFGKFGRQQVVLEGNHDIRIKTMMYKHMQEAFDLRPVRNGAVIDLPSLSLEYLLGLDDAGIEWVEGYPDNKWWFNDYLCAEHGNVVSASPGGTAPKVLKNNMTFSSFFGHIHRREMATQTIRDRDGHRTLSAICPGFLGRIDGVVPGSKRNSNWNQGASVVFFDDTPDFRETHFPINNGRTFLLGEEFIAEDFSEEIESAEGVGFF